jgi:hypothetical protein
MIEFSKEEYLAVLKTEIETLKMYYYKPNEEGTGHYNTAISVLEERYKTLQDSLITQRLFCHP